MDPAALSVPALDQLCNACLSLNNDERQAAERILLEFQGFEDTWLKIPGILAETTNEQTRFFALQVLEKLVKNRWASIGSEQRKNVREFVAGTIGTCTANGALLSANRAYVRKLDSLLVQILQVDWPQEWPTFVDDLLTSSHADRATCENNLVILRLLSEGMHEYYEQNLSTQRSKVLRANLMLEFHKIFPLLVTILGDVKQIPSQDADLSLLKAAVDAASQFLLWIEGQYVYGTGIIDSLLIYLSYPSLALSAMTGLSLIASLFSSEAALDPDAPKDHIVGLAYGVMQAIDSMVGSQGGPASQGYAAWSSSVNDGQINALASLLINIIVDNVFLDNWRDHVPFLARQTELLLEMSLHADDEILKMNFDCQWISFLDYIAQERTRYPALGQDDIRKLINISYYGGALAPGEGTPELREVVELREWLKPILRQAVLVVYERMVPPAEEQTVVTDGELDEPSRERLGESEQLALHASMRDFVVVHSHLYYFDSMEIVKEKLGEFTEPPFDRAKLDKVVWVLGALATRLLHASILPAALLPTLRNDEPLHPLGSPTMTWFVDVVHTFLALLQRCPDPDERMYLNTQIVFLLGRCPRCLDEDADLLRLVLGKVFGILHDPKAPTSSINMAIDSLEIISYFNRGALCDEPPDGAMSLIEQLLVQERPAITAQYSTNHIVLSSVYSSFGAAIRPLWWGSQGPRLLAILFQDINPEFSRWMELVMSGPPGTVATPEAYQFFFRALRLSIGVAGTLKGGFSPEMEFLEPFLPVLYARISAYIAESVQRSGIVVAGHSTIRWLRRVRRKILLLAIVHGAGICVDSASNSQANVTDFHRRVQRFSQVALPALLDVVLLDWLASPLELREVEAMDLCDQSMNNLGAVMPTEVLQRTISQIVDSMVEYIESRSYLMYSEIRRSQYFVLGFACSTRLIQMERLPRADQERVLKISLEGMKVYNRDVAKNALVMAYHFFGNFHPSIVVPTSFEPSRTPPPDSAFLALAVEPILDGVWDVMTDSEHKNTFENQAPIVARIFDILSESPRQVLDSSRYEPGESNRGWVDRWFQRSLVRSFPQLAANPVTCAALFQQLWDLPRRSTADEDAFGIVLREFFLDLAQFRQSDNSALFAQAQNPARESEAARQRIPSLAGSKRAARLMLFNASVLEDVD